MPASSIRCHLPSKVTCGSAHSACITSHLFFRPPAAIVEILVQSDELHRVPADPDAEAEAAARQHVQAGRLLGHQHGLPLRQDQDLGGEPDAGRAGAQKAEQHERVVEQVGRGVARPPVRPARDIDAEHVVGRGEVVIPGRLCRLREGPHVVRRAADVGERQCDAQLHWICSVPAMIGAGCYQPRPGMSPPLARAMLGAPAISEGRVLRLGYKASAEQFGPAALLSFGVMAEQAGFELGIRERPLPAMEAYGRPCAVLARLARRAGGQHHARHARHQRAVPQLPLPPRHRGAGVRHAGGDVSGARGARHRHRGVAERGAGHRHAVARVQGTLRPPARGGDADPPVVARGAGDVRGRVLPHRERDHLRPAGEPRCRSMSPPPGRWSRAMPAAPATG